MRGTTYHGILRIDLFTGVSALIFMLWLSVISILLQILLIIKNLLSHPFKDRKDQSFPPTFVNGCMYVCMCAYVHVCVLACVFVCVLVSLCVHMCVPICVYVCVCTCVCLYVGLCVLVWLHLYVL